MLDKNPLTQPLLQVEIPLCYQSVAVGLSGGVDSMVLAHALIQKKKAGQLKKLCFLHVNYGLRAQESHEDEDFVRSFAHTHDVSCAVYHAPKPPTQNIQAWARNIRRQWFLQWAKEGWSIALAHHLNDVAENTVLRLSRGTSIGHMAGLRQHQHPFLRPLLCLTKDDISNYAKAHQIAFREDSSNQKEDYARNKIRHSILPTLEDLHKNASYRIARTAMQAQDILDWVRQPYQGRTHIQRSEIADMPKSVALEVISTIISPKEQWLSHKMLENIYFTIMENSHGCWTRPDQIRCLVKGGTLKLE